MKTGYVNYEQAWNFLAWIAPSKLEVSSLVGCLKRAKIIIFILFSPHILFINKVSLNSHFLPVAEKNISSAYGEV